MYRTHDRKQHADRTPLISSSIWHCFLRRESPYDSLWVAQSWLSATCATHHTAQHHSATTATCPPEATVNDPVWISTQASERVSSAVLEAVKSTHRRQSMRREWSMELLSVVNIECIPECRMCHATTCTWCQMKEEPKGFPTACRLRSGERYSSIPT